MLNDRPLVAHTVAAVAPEVDRCVLVLRKDLIRIISALDLDAELVEGGKTRTMSEQAGLSVLGDDYDLIGIHDAARPLITAGLITRLFDSAASVGGAVPALEQPGLLLDKRSLEPIDRAMRVQTPQVFRGPALIEAFARAIRAGYDGHDTAEVVERFGDLDIAAVPGDPANIKVTVPGDLDLVRSLMRDPGRSEPR